MTTPLAFPSFQYEDTHGRNRIVAGIDEVGYGTWAGPVVSACVYIDRSIVDSQCLKGIKDSKLLSSSQREHFFDLLTNTPGIHYGVGEASVDEIDNSNILIATHLAMKRALEQINQEIDIILVDGNKKPDLGAYQVETIVQGDKHVFSISCASIIAKVTRDRYMKSLSHHFPNYKWESNVGYGTKDHKEALEKYGVTPHHRQSYAPIKKALELKGMLKI